MDLAAVEDVWTVMEGSVFELPESPKAEVVKVVNAVSVDPECTLEGVGSSAAGLVVAAVGSQLLMEKVTLVDPHPHIRAV